MNWQGERHYIKELFQEVIKMEQDPHKIIRRMNTVVLHRFISHLDEIYSTIRDQHPDEIQIYDILKLKAKAEIKRREEIRIRDKEIT